MVRGASVLAACLVAGGAVSMLAQGRPKAEVTAVAPPAAVRPGTVASVSVKVKLPADVHVQANKPRDPALIPTVLTVTPPEGVTVEGIAYPKPKDFAQAGQSQPLAVYESEFSIDVRLTLAKTLKAGSITVPAKLRYQACNTTVCFPPATVDTQWVVPVTASPK